MGGGGDGERGKDQVKEVERGRRGREGERRREGKEVRGRAKQRR